MKIKGLMIATLVLLLAYQVADLAWRFWVPISIVSNKSSRIGVAPLPQADTLDLQALTQANLFGENSVSAPKPEPAKPTTKVKTRLAIKLLGVIWSPEPGRSVAILLHDGKQRAYLEGEPLDIPQQAHIVKVLKNRVVLEVDGREEYVEMEPASLGKSDLVRGAGTVTGIYRPAEPRDLTSKAPNKTRRQ